MSIALSPRAQRLFLHIGICCMAPGDYPVSYDTLAEATEMDRRSVVRLVKVLESAGLISIERGGKRGFPNIYRIVGGAI